jgi:XTP/dITP diphosphohydrolase
MIEKLVIATNNPHKLEEFKILLKPYVGSVLSLKDIDYNFDIDEKGKTFAENAAVKANAIKPFCNLPILADDSGLCVGHLDGGPGIFSARYAGQNASDKSNRDKLKAMMLEKGLVQTGAYFECALTLLVNGSVYSSSGICEGVLIDEERGENGFGYDSLFFILTSFKTMAQMSMDEKNIVSHRSKAVKNLFSQLTIS